MTTLADRLRAVIEDHRGNRTGTYSGASNYVLIADLEPLLDEQETDATTGHFIAPDADDEPTIWCGNPDDDYPHAAISRHDFRRCPELWHVLVAAIEGGQ